MLPALSVLLLYQLAGEALVMLLRLPVPGPVVGMALLFLTLVARGGAPDGLRDTAQSLLQHLSLLFVPAGVGVMLHFQRIGEEWLPILVAVPLSTLAAIAVTSLVLRALQGRSHADERT